MLALLIQVILLIVKSLAGFLCVLLLLRFFMQLFRVSFANRFGDFIVKLTNWLVIPLRRVLPSVHGLDLATLLPAYLLQVLVVAVLVFAGGGMGMLSAEMLVPLLFWRGLLAILRLSVYLLIGALLVQAVLSWVQPYGPLMRPLAQFTDPFLRPLLLVVPPIAGFDLTPLIAVLLAQIVLIFL